MNKIVLTVLALSLIAVASAQSQITFVDVPPCHWASGAVTQISGSDRAQPESNARTAANALEQVFAGLQCGNAQWVARFVSNLPANFSVSEGTVRSFNLRVLETRIQGQTASLRYQLTLKLATGAVTRSGTARLTANPDTGWQVAYASLLEMKLPFFP
jgi:hypothetical protein